MKPRSDAKLLNLPAADQDRISAWLLDGVETDEGRDTSYAAVKEAVFLDLGIKTSANGLSEFYRKICAPRRLRSSAVAAEQFIEGAEANGAQFSAAAKSLCKQKFFELVANGNCDAKELSAFGSLVADFDRGDLKRIDQQQKAEDIKIKFRRLELLESAAREAKDKLTTLASKGGLTPETLAQIEQAAALL